jgi:hypothetical protein
MNRSLITACFCFVPFVTGCALSEEKTATDPSQPEELAAADEEVSPPPAHIFGSDACKNTDITITNSRTRDGINTAIEVQYVKYWDASEGAWLMEDLANYSLNFGTGHTWWNEDLEYTENDLITAFRVYYKVLEGGSWGPVVYQEIDTPNQTCREDSNFSMTVQ